jgi:hypothetical protein
MTLIKKYNFTEKEISDIVVDTNNSEYLWVAFKQDASGNCALKKVSANNPLQTYFDIDIATNEIMRLVVSGAYLYVALNDTTYFGQIYSVSNPLSSVTSITIPSGITEVPVDLLVDSYLYFLLPGNLSGTNAKICVFSTAGVFSETIDLPGINNASAFTIDTNDNLWIVTNEDPVKLIRVWFDVTWQIQTTEL